MLDLREAVRTDHQRLQRGKALQGKGAEEMERPAEHPQRFQCHAVLDVQLAILSRKTLLLEHDALQTLQIANPHSENGTQGERADRKAFEFTKRSKIKHSTVHVVTLTIGNHQLPHVGGDSSIIQALLQHLEGLFGLSRNGISDECKHENQTNSHTKKSRNRNAQRSSSKAALLLASAGNHRLLHGVDDYRGSRAHRGLVLLTDS